MQQQELQERGRWPPRLTVRRPLSTGLSRKRKEARGKEGRNENGPYSGLGHTHLQNGQPLCSRCTAALLHRQEPPAAGTGLLQKPNEVATSGAYSIKPSMPGSKQDSNSMQLTQITGEAHGSTARWVVRTSMLACSNGLAHTYDLLNSCRCNGRLPLFTERPSPLGGDLAAPAQLIAVQPTNGGSTGKSAVVESPGAQGADSAHW